MLEKQKSSHNWKNPKTIIAAVSVTGLLTLWNTFATHDRQRTEALNTVVSTPSAIPEMGSDNLCPTPNPAQNPGNKCVTITRTKSS